jgi:nitroimidazol reductase NimA-like FMN-containing flavoprotein (pyridoxamine 5'-phosphate oxidase superfamily)
MRRTDREISDLPEIESLLNKAIVCRIGMADSGKPSIVPVCFGYSDGKIYLHSAVSGKKLSCWRKNPRCCFEVDQCDGLIRGEQPCASEMRYQSVIGFGRGVYHFRKY